MDHERGERGPAERARLMDEQVYLTLGSMGQVTEHPAKHTYDAASRRFLRYASEFALTTLALTRLGLLDAGCGLV
jgi:hypothetical protein